MKTLNGFLLSDLADLLDQPLHHSAYKPITGGCLATYLTDISIVWQRRVFNKIFGIYSIGWGFDVNPDHIVTTEGTTSSGKPNYETSIKGMFWFKYIKDGKELKSEFLVTGAHKDNNGNIGYSMKGAFTNAIGFGGSCLGWQESVYMGERSHSSPKTSAPARKIFKSLQEMMSLKVEDEPVTETKTTAPQNTHIRITKSDDKPKAETSNDAKMKIHYFNCSQCGGISQVRSNCTTVIESCPDCKVEMFLAKDKEQCLERQKQNKEELRLAALEVPETSMIYPVCLHCGFLDPVNELETVCRGCGICQIGDKPIFSIQKNLETAQKMSASIKTTEPEVQDRKLLDEAKSLAGSSRGYLLQVASELSGSSVKAYTEMSNALLMQVIEKLRTEKENEPETEDPKGSDLKVMLAKVSKTDKIRQIYKSAVGPLGGVSKVVGAISERVGRKITSSNDLNADELDSLYVAWVVNGELKK